MTTVPPIQDMPPQGGFSKIIFERVPAQRFWTGRRMFGLALFGHFIPIAYYLKSSFPREQRHLLETAGAKEVCATFWRAEKDRLLLQQMRKNRDYEAELMKDVPGWVVGTWYGERIYKTIGRQDWEHPWVEELYAHGDKSDANCLVNEYGEGTLLITGIASKI